MEQAIVAWLRRREAGAVEELERSLPVGVTRRRVWMWGERLAFRNVERGLVRSMVGFVVGVRTAGVAV
jgi:hypothetical protein